MSRGLSVLTKPPEQLQPAWEAEPTQFGLLPSNGISSNVFVTKEHLLPWMSNDKKVYIPRNKLCERFRDWFLSPLLRLKQMEDRHPKSFTEVTVEHMWKHCTKSQIVLAPEIRSRPFIYLKYKVLWVWFFLVWGFFLSMLLFSRHQNTFSCCHCPQGQSHERTREWLQWCKTEQFWISRIRLKKQAHWNGRDTTENNPISETAWLTIIYMHPEHMCTPKTPSITSPGIQPLSTIIFIHTSC